MSKDKDPHPVIRFLAVQDGWHDSADTHIDPTEFNSVQEGKFLLAPPQTRMEYLDALDTAIGREDGTTLEKKAQLLDLRRRVGTVHNNLRRVGR